MMIKDKYYTTSQAALIVGFSQDHVRRLILQGRLKAEKLGNGWVIKHKDLALIKRKRRNLNGNNIE
jgi:excisionase family DNA binding protein